MFSFQKLSKPKQLSKSFPFFPNPLIFFSPTEPGSSLIFVKLIALTFCERSTQQNEYAQKGKKILYKKYVSKLNDFFFKILNKVPVLCWLWYNFFHPHWLATGRGY